MKKAYQLRLISFSFLVTPTGLPSTIALGSKFKIKTPIASAIVFSFKQKKESQLSFFCFFENLLWFDSLVTPTGLPSAIALGSEFRKKSKQFSIVSPDYS
jgi:hypothetical protein